MGALDIAALVVIFLLIIAVTVAIVMLGSLPGKIARKRGHPYPDGVNAASWIGLATGVFWPLAFIWAFVPVPARRSEAGSSASSDNTELTAVRQRVEALEADAMKIASVRAGEAS